MKLIPRDFDLFTSPFENWHSLMNFKNPMNTDIIEDGKNLKIVVDLPGVKKENVKITLENAILTVSASSKGGFEEKNKEGNYIRRERHSGTYTRSFSVSENLSKEDVKASMNDGVLTLTIPKKTEKEPETQTIEIE